jgi:hypothetical protein
MSATKKRELYSLSPGCQRFYQLKASLFVFIFCQASKHVFLQGLNPCNVVLYLQKSRLEAGFFTLLQVVILLLQPLHGRLTLQSPLVLYHPLLNQS